MFFRVESTRKDVEEDFAVFAPLRENKEPAREKCAQDVEENLPIFDAEMPRHERAISTECHGTVLQTYRNNEFLRQLYLESADRKRLRIATIL